MGSSHKDSRSIRLPSTLIFSVKDGNEMSTMEVDMVNQDNFSSGFYVVSRSLKLSPVWQNPVWLKVWLWCIDRAAFKSKHVPFSTGKGTTIVTLDRGQFITGRKSGANELAISEGTFRNILCQFQKMGKITIKKDSHFSLITVCNYNEYQNIENYKGQATIQAEARQRPGKGQAKDTNNNDKNNKNDKKENKKRRKEEEKDIAETAVSSDTKKFIDHAFQTFQRKHGEKMLIDGAKDGAIVKRLLGSYDFEKLCSLWDAFLSSDDAFTRQAGYSIGIFKTQINKLLSGGNGGLRPVQPGVKAWLDEKRRQNAARQGQ